MINQLIPKIKKEISIIKSENELMSLKSKYLGKKGELTSYTNSIKDLSIEEKTVNSPMVGTFYRAASPDAAPFVDVVTCDASKCVLLNGNTPELGDPSFTFLISTVTPILASLDEKNKSNEVKYPLASPSNDEGFNINVWANGSP